MSRLIAGLRSPDGRVLVDGFYDDVAGATAAELTEWAGAPRGPRVDPCPGRDARESSDGTGSSVLERLWVEPTLDVVGIWGGYAGDGLKTIIPAQAHAKISCRLVPDQAMETVAARLVAHLEAHCPAEAELSIDWELHGAGPAVMPPEHPAVVAARDALSDGFGVEAVLTRLGVSVPVNEIVDRLLGMPAAMLGYSSPTGSDPRS